MWDAFAVVGGLIVFLYLIGYVLTITYAKYERKVDTVIRIFYYSAAKQEHKIKTQNLNF